MREGKGCSPKLMGLFILAEPLPNSVDRCHTQMHVPHTDTDAYVTTCHTALHRCTL